MLPPVESGALPSKVDTFGLPLARPFSIALAEVRLYASTPCCSQEIATASGV